MPAFSGAGADLKFHPGEARFKGQKNCEKKFWVDVLKKFFGSAIPLIAARKQTSPEVRVVPGTDIRPTVAFYEEIS